MKHVVLDTLALLLNARFDEKQADAQIRMVGMLTDHHATREDLQALEVKLEAKIDGTRKDLEAKIDGTRKDLEAKIDGTRKDLEAKIETTKSSLEAKIARASNKTILAVFGMNIGLLGLLVGALKLWPGIA